MNAKTIFSLLLLQISWMNSHAADVVFDKRQSIAKISEINNIQETYRECTDEYMNGKITKVEGKYPSISIFFKSLDGKKTSAADLDLHEMDMVTLKSLDTIVFKGNRVKTYIQRCGSGAIPNLIFIKSITKE